MTTISIDTGNKQIKTENYTFVSGVSDNVNTALSSPDDLFKINGKSYTLTRERQPYLRDKTSDDRYFNLVMFGIVKELDLKERTDNIFHSKDAIFDIHLLCGLPPAHMKDTALKNKYASYFRTDEPIRVVYKNKSWNIHIKKVTVYAQCFAALMSEYEKIKDEPRVLGIDMGGFTADYISIRRGKFDVNASDSLESGIIILYQKIKKAALVKDTILEEEDIDDVLLKRANKLDVEIVRLINSETERFVEGFLGNFREFQIDLRNQYVIFMGGAALALRDFLQNSPLIKNCKFIEDINANAVGYKKLWEISKQR